MSDYFYFRFKPMLWFGMKSICVIEAVNNQLMCSVMEQHTKSEMKMWCTLLMWLVLYKV